MRRLKTSVKFGTKGQDKTQKIKVPRTIEGTIFELTFLVGAAVVWLLVLIMLSNAPDVIATHFDGNGRPNGYGSPWGLLFPCIITTVTGVGLLIGAYFPHRINVPVSVYTPRQYELLIRMVRIAALLFLLMTLAIPATAIVLEGSSAWPILSIVGLLMVVIIYYCVKIHRENPSGSPCEGEKEADTL